MILKRFKEKSNKNYINSQLNKRIVKPNNSKIACVAVIVNLEELSKLPNFNSFAKLFNIKNSAIEIINVKKGNDLPNLTFTDKDLGWGGTIKNDELKKILNKKFDILVSYYKNDNTFLKLITVASKARFKIGILETDERLNDLIIKTEVDDFETFTTELKKYLSIINQ